MNVLKTIGKKSTDIVLILGAICLLTSVLAYGMNSILRFAKMPLSWPEEYCTYIIVFAVFLIQARLEFQDDELCIGVLEGLMKKHMWLNKVLYSIRYIVTGIMYVAIINVMVKIIKQNFAYGTVTPVLRVSFGIYYVMIAVCFGIALITIALKLVEKLAERRETNE